MMALLQSIPSFLVAIIVLVTVHEFGHFYVARLCGVRVIRFSIGFGKVLWRRYDKQGTEFSISALPLGGYVKMLDEREGEVPTEQLSQAFTRKTVWQRLAIVAAGPVANFILAILLFWALLLQGEKGAIPIIASVKPNSPAAQAGLLVGQEIRSIDSIATLTEQDVAKVLMNRLGESGELYVEVQLSNSTEVKTLSIPLNQWLKGAKDPDPLDALGLALVPIKPVVGTVLPNSPAANAGLKVGDLIVQVDNQPTPDWRDFQHYIQPRAGVPVTLVIERKTLSGNTQTISLPITPESFADKAVSYGRIGIGNQPLNDQQLRHFDYSVTQAFTASLSKTWDTAGFVLLSVKKLILGEISTKNLSGPISIAKVAGSSAMGGLKSFVGFIALLSVLLGVFNLLPIPVLDGGHIAYLTIEIIKGKPVSEQTQMLGYQMGFALIIGLSLLAMYNDIMRL